MKKLLAIIFSLGLLAGCTAEVEETSGTTVTSESAETTDETESTAAVPPDGIREALKAEWDNRKLDLYTVDLYAADLNGDGVKELFANYTFTAAASVITYVYDVSDGAEKLCEIPARMWTEKCGLYSGESGAVHLIKKETYAGGIGEKDIAYFDIAYSGAEMPVYAKEYDWYDGGAHLTAYDLYKNCQPAPFEFVNDLYGWRNFDPEKAEYIGRFDWEDVSAAFDGGGENEIGEIIQKEVFDGMTYISDIEEIYGCSVGDDFDAFWKEVSAKLAEVYGE